MLHAALSLPLPTFTTYTTFIRKHPRSAIAGTPLANDGWANGIADVA
jgi:hypothetical protein